VHHERVELSRKTADGYIIPLGTINLVSVVTDSGIVGCGVFDVHAFNALGYPAAKVRKAGEGLIATVDDLLNGIIKEVNESARERGVHIGMSGRDALELM
jgi:uncharacterized protein YunC (DUF1805 family)